MSVSGGERCALQVCNTVLFSGPQSARELLIDALTTSSLSKKGTETSCNTSTSTRVKRGEKSTLARDGFAPKEPNSFPSKVKIKVKIKNRE